MKTNLIILGAAITGILSTSGASAEMLWSTASLTYLKGNNHELGDNSRQVVTFEHASSHSWGDNFMFIDRSISDNDDVSTYFEVLPRLSISKLVNEDLSFGIVKDVLFAGTWESSEESDNYLSGIGVSLDIPGFNYFSANVYHADNELWEDDVQTTIAWELPFNIGNSEFVLDGFLDWSSAERDHASEELSMTQLKWNAGKLFGSKAPIYLGVEYIHWNNKYGIQGIDESNVQFILKAHM